MFIQKDNINNKIKSLFTNFKNYNKGKQILLVFLAILIILNIFLYFILILIYLFNSNNNVHQYVPNRSFVHRNPRPFVYPTQTPSLTIAPTQIPNPIINLPTKIADSKIIYFVKDSKDP